MATVQSVVCDECGRAKGDANHWFVHSYQSDLDISKTVFLVMPAAYFEDMLKLGAIPSDDPKRDYCSQQCVTTIFQRWLDTGNVDKPQVVHPDPDPVEVAEVADEEAESK